MSVRVTERMNENRSLEALNLFYSLLVSYELALKEILGSGQAVFVQPVLTNFVKLGELTGVDLLQTESFEETLQNLSEVLESAGLLRRLHFEKLNENKYVICVDRCHWAPQLHKKLDPRGFVCPYALMTMSIFQLKTRERVRFLNSKFLDDGSRTIIKVV